MLCLGCHEPAAQGTTSLEYNQAEYSAEQEQYMRLGALQGVGHGDTPIYVSQY